MVIESFKHFKYKSKKIDFSLIIKEEEKVEEKILKRNKYQEEDLVKKMIEEKQI